MGLSYLRPIWRRRNVPCGSLERGTVRHLFFRAGRRGVVSTLAMPPPSRGQDVADPLGSGGSSGASWGTMRPSATACTARRRILS